MADEGMDPRRACTVRVRRIIEGVEPFRAEDFERVARCLVALGVDVRDVKARTMFLGKVWGVPFRGEWWALLQRLRKESESDGAS